MARIAMLVSNRYDPDPRVQKQAATLVEAGHSVRVYAYDRQREMDVREENLEGVEIMRLQLGRSTYGSAVSAALGLREFHREVRRRLLLDPPDVVHCHDQDTCPVGLWSKRHVRSAGSARHASFVFDAHEFYWTYMLRPDPSSRVRRLGASLLKARDRYYARRANLLITVTDGIGAHPGTAQLYREWGCDPLVIWNAPRKVESIPNLPERFTVGYFGMVRHTEMFEWLVRAIECLPPEERPAVRLAGGGIKQRQVASLLRAASERLGFPLVIIDAFAMHELPGLMADCSVQYCLYLRGTRNIDRAMPVKLLDAVAYHRPVIGNCQTLMGDWIGANRWGWQVEEGDIRGLADALRQARAGSNPGHPPTPLTPPPFWEDQAARLRQAYRALLTRT